MITKLTPDWIRSVSEAHVTLDPTAFLSQPKEIGVHFRERIFYPAVLSHPQSFVWIYKVGDRLAGYIVGTKDTSDFYQYLKSFRPFRLSLLIAKASLKNPKLLVQCFHLRRKFNQPSQEQFAAAEIISLGVLPEFRTKEFEQAAGTHVADHLFQKGIMSFKELNVKKFQVSTIETNEPANIFYREHGCERAGTTRPFQVACNVFVKNIS